MATIEEIPENLLLEVLSYLPVKDLCTAGGVCKQWRRIVKDNSLWRHVNLLPYHLHLTAMWKVLRVHFSPCLLTMRIRGYFNKTASRKRKRALVSDAMILELGKRCPNLHLLHLHDSNTEQVHSSSLPPSVRELCVTSCHWQRGWLGGLNQHLPHLKTLDLSGTVGVTNRDLEEDVTQLLCLAHLKLHGCYRVGTPGLAAVAKARGSALQSLDISDTMVDGEGLHHLARHCKGLHKLELDKLKCLDDSSLLTLTGGLVELRELSLLDCRNVSQGGLKALWSLAKLQRVAVSDDVLPTDKEKLCFIDGFTQKVEIFNGK